MTNVHVDYTHMEHNADINIAEMGSDACQKDVQHGWGYKDMEESNLPANDEDSNSVLKPVLKEKKSR